jgi:hypothetical protein
MSQKSSLPQAAKSVSQVLMSDNLDARKKMSALGSSSAKPKTLR